ncbi:hypothetical protein [Paenibacillus sp. NRS-1780]|uniref:hypothetical protein n=1 Tax=Paenibacillus sp. NRS-1780 TaxID=3233904 RepID=UPI003D2DE8B1
MAEGNKFNPGEIKVGVSIDSWLEVFTTGSARAFEQAVKAGMPPQLAEQEYKQLVKRMIPEATKVTC